MAESIAELCPTIMWEAELISSELSYLAEEICKQSIKGIAWIPLAVYTKTWEQRHKLNKELLSKRGVCLLEVDNLGKPIQISKKILKLGDSL